MLAIICKKQEGRLPKDITTFADRRVAFKEIQHQCRRSIHAASNFDAKPWWLRARYLCSKQAREAVYQYSAEELPNNITIPACQPPN